VDTLALNDRIAELEQKIVLLQDQLSHGVPVPAKTKEESTAEKDRTETVKKTEKGKKSAKSEPSSDAGGLNPAGKKPDSVWEEALKQLRITDPGIHGMLVQTGQYLGFDGTAYRWKAKPSFDVCAQSLNVPAKKGKIEEALTASAGVPSTFLAMTASQESGENEGLSEDAYLEGIRKSFGADRVTVIDELSDRNDSGGMS
jgi:hypothetical protein